MLFRDNLEIPGGNTWRRIKVGWTGVFLCIREVLKLAREMVFKGDRGQIAKRQIPDIRWTYTKGIIDFKRNFDEKMYIVSMGMNAKFKVDSHFSNAQPFIHFSRSMKL